MAPSTKPASRAEPVPRNRLALAILAAVSAALFFVASSALMAPAARAAAPIFKGSSADGSIAFFETDQQMVPGDTDSQRDVYERSFDEDVGEAGAYVTREVSTGPTGGNDAYPAQFEAASADGSRVFFSTEESLVAADTDRKSDIYVHELGTGATTLVTQGSASCAPACGNGAFDAGIAAADSGGDNLFFVTGEKLAEGDSDNAVDIYKRNLSTETTTLVSVAATSCSGSCGNGSDPDNAVMWGLSADGSTAFFTTPESLSTADTDSTIDIYARNLSEGVTTLVSQADSSCGGCSNEGKLPVFRGSSADGSRVFFITAERLAEGDSDSATDIYARDLPGGPTLLVSSGGGEDTPAAFSAVDASGEHAFFTTGESLVGGADTNGANDVYEWTDGGGSPSLITSGSCTQGAAQNCGSFFDAAVGSSTVFFTTTESLAPADNDTSGGADIYAQEVGGGEPVWVSEGDAECQPECGNAGTAAVFDGVADGGSKVFFATSEAMTAADKDATSDIYVRDLTEASTSLSTSTASGYCPIPAGEGGCPANYGGVSEAGDHLFFSTSRASHPRRRRRHGERRLRARFRPGPRSRGHPPGLGRQLARPRTRPGAAGPGSDRSRIAERLDDAVDPRPVRSRHLDQAVHRTELRRRRGGDGNRGRTERRRDPGQRRRGNDDVPGHRDRHSRRHLGLLQPDPLYAGKPRAAAWRRRRRRGRRRRLRHPGTPAMPPGAVAARGRRRAPPPLRRPPTVESPTSSRRPASPSVRHSRRASATPSSASTTRPASPAPVSSAGSTAAVGRVARRPSASRVCAAVGTSSG